MEITLAKANEADKTTIQNLGRFYVYEMSRYCGFLPGWETPPNGLFECIDFSSYFEKPDNHPFLIKIDGELAGFVLVNKKGSSLDVNWNMGEFFVLAKFQNRGVGCYVATLIFNQFSGIWEVAQMPENKAAIVFWEKTISQYTHGYFTTTCKTFLEPEPHPMIVLKFTTSNLTT